MAKLHVFYCFPFFSLPMCFPKWSFQDSPLKMSKPKGSLGRTWYLYHENPQITTKLQLVHGRFTTGGFRNFSHLPHHVVVVGRAANDRLQERFFGEEMFSHRKKLYPCPHFSCSPTLFFGRKKGNVKRNSKGNVKNLRDPKLFLTKKEYITMII